MSQNKFHRRMLLKGFLGGALVSIGLPALEIFLNDSGSAYADEGPGDSGFPQRFGLFFWGNGMLPDRWTPEKEGSDWELSEQLAPLANVKEYITVVTGTGLGVPNTTPHAAGAGGILSGAPLLDPYSNDSFSIQSIDQVIAEKTKENTFFPSLEFGAKPGGGLSYNGPNSRNPPESSPLAFFNHVFGGTFQLPGAEPIVDPTLALRRSVLDAVMGDISWLKTKVGQADQIRLEQHFEGVRGLEKRLARLEEDPPNLAACEFPTQPLEAYPDIEGRPQLQEKNQIMSEIAAMAFACDRTRVFSNFFTSPVNNNLFTDAVAGHHQLTHDEPGDQPQVHAINLQCMEALARQIEALAAIEEGEGTLLDNCVLFGTSEHGLAQTHSFEEMPIVLAGSCGGKLKTNMHYRSAASENSSKVLLTICRAMGLDQSSFGAEGGKVTDGLGAIEA
jgi:hypothetical protein